MKSQFEFVCLMALLMSLAALAIDAILPALAIIRTEFQVQNVNDTQFVISSLFFGLSIGQLFYGPLSDSYGRKPIIYFGVILFILGCILSVLSTSFEILLLSRFLQGIGVASTRIVSLAIVRDQFTGNSMAKIMSLITMVFVIVPAIAPSIGQIILSFTKWRSIFVLLMALALIGLIWLKFRLTETHPKEARSKLSLLQIKLSVIELWQHRPTLIHTISSGIIFGAFLGYIFSAQQIFQEIYYLKEEFPYYFGVLAIANGISSFINSKLVEKFGMLKLVKYALYNLNITSALYLAYSLYLAEQPSLLIFMLYMLISFGSMGILFGNLNSLAMAPHGHIAGVASAFISTLQNVFSITLAVVIGMSFNQTTLPLVGGYLILSLLAQFMQSFTRKNELAKSYP